MYLGLLFIVTASLCRDWVICASVAIVGCDSSVIPDYKTPIEKELII